MSTIKGYKAAPAVIAAVLMSISITACSKPKLSIENVQAEFSPAMRDESAVYLTIRNEGGSDTLTAAKVDIPGASADIHEMRGGMMILTNALPVPAKSEIELGPLGSHIMITRLPAEMKEGSHFQLTLFFKKSGAVLVPITFTAPRPQQAMPGPHH